MSFHLLLKLISTHVFEETLTIANAPSSSLKCHIVQVTVIAIESIQNLHILIVLKVILLNILIVKVKKQQYNDHDNKRRKRQRSHHRSQIIYPRRVPFLPRPFSKNLNLHGLLLGGKFDIYMDTAKL